MGLFSKFKKKLTKGLRKITPKEIAPILPFVAMAVPGMGGIMGSTMARYLVPQLLTAAGSARTSGKINPLNQLLAAGASYAAGPGSMASTPDQMSFMDKKIVTGGQGATIGGPGALKPNAMGTGPIAGSNLAYSPGMNATEFARANPDSFKTFTKAPNFKSQNTFMDTINQKVTQPFGQSIRNIGSGDISNIGFGDIMKVGSLGATAAGIDQSTLAQLEAEAEAAKNAGDVQGYREASAAVAAAIARFSDPTNQYGNNPFMANQGGRVGYDNGSGPMGVQGLSSMMAPFLPEVTPSLPEALRERDLQRLIDARPSLPKERGLKSLEELKLMEQMRELEKIEEEAFRLMMEQQMSDNEPIIMGPETYNTGRANGGRIGMNMGGGLGSIPQTPTVPQGMQLDGRGGGFIPMGAQERKDDVPAMLAKNEFVMTADAVRAAGGGSIEKGAQKMYDVMNQLESQV